MQHSLKALVRITVVLASILTFAIGCSTPVYFHYITHTYDGNNKLIKVVEEEGITQVRPTSSPLNVKISYPSQILKGEP
jgi:hypothetical protein